MRNAMGNASLSPSLFTRWERIFPVYISIGKTLLHPHFLMEEFSAMKRVSVSIVISIGRLVCCRSICGEGCACRGGCGVGVRSCWIVFFSLFPKIWFVIRSFGIYWSCSEQYTLGPKKVYIFMNLDKYLERFIEKLYFFSQMKYCLFLIRCFR